MSPWSVTFKGIVRIIMYNKQQTIMYRKKLELPIIWKTEDCYELDSITLLLVEEKVAAILKARKVLKENPDIDSIRIRIDQTCLASMGDARLGYGFVIVHSGSQFFIGYDNYDSRYKVETDTFELDGECPKDYFNIVHSGWNDASKREEIQVRTGEHGNLFMFQDDGKLGFIVDVYGQTDHVSTLQVWEEDLNDGEFEFKKGEEEIYKRDWGQTDEEISSCLGYDNDDGLAELLMSDYFWLESESKWYPKCASGYSGREQEIADHLKS